MLVNSEGPHRRHVEGTQQQQQQPSPPHEPAAAEPVWVPSNTVLSFAQREGERQLENDAALVAAMDDEDADPLLHPAPIRALTHIRECEESRLRGDPWRFAVVPIFCLLNVCNAMQWIAFSPIVDEVRTFFHMTATQVNFLSTTYVIAYVAVVFLSCKLYEVTGIKMGILIAASSNTVGALLKIVALYAWPNAVLLYIAQVFNSFTEVLTIATPPLISNRWFPERERTVANTIASSALNFGCGVGVLIPTFFVGPEKQAKQHFGHLFWFHFAFAAAMLLLVIFLFPKKPRYSASHIAAHQQNREERHLRALDHVLQRRNSSSSGDDSDHADGGEMCDGGEDDGQPRQQWRKRGGPRSKATGEHEPTGIEDGLSQHADTAAAAYASAVTIGKAPVGRSAVVRQGVEVEGEEDNVAEREEEEPEVQPVNIFSVLMDCFREFQRNWSFVLLAIGSAAELGLIWGVATVLPQMLSPYGISEATAGWIGFLNLVLGTVVCPFFMPLVERHGRRYKLLLCIFSVVLVSVMVLLTLLLHFGPPVDGNERYYTVITFVLWGGVAGLCQNFMMPLMFEYVVELTFPMAESTSAPVLTWSACLTNFLLTLILGEVLTDTPDEHKALQTFIGATVVSVIGSVALFLTKPMTKRTDYEQRRGLELEERKRRLQMAAAEVVPLTPGCGVDGGSHGDAAEDHAKSKKD